jgi:chitinase
VVRSLRLIAAALGAAAVLMAIPASGQAAPWVSGYYAGWMRDQLPPSAIDYDGVTQVIDFSVLPNADGTLDTNSLGLDAARSAQLIAAAHAKGVKVLLCVGGEGTRDQFRNATSPANLDRFVHGLVKMVKQRGYDGLDVDWEPVDGSDAPQFKAFIKALRTKLNAQTPRRLLTAAVGWEPALFASLQRKFDQLDLMTYVMSGPWDGWVTWFDSPLHDGGFEFPCCAGERVPSVDGMVKRYADAGISKSKLGFGADFYGAVWQGGGGTDDGGVTKPRQSWTAPPSVDYQSYNQIQSSYTGSGYTAHYDDTAQAAWIGHDVSGSAGDRFIAYDDPAAMRAKADYLRSEGLGGIIFWEMGGEYVPGAPAGQRHPLIDAFDAELAS